jgi:hypothetical protein
MIGPSFIGFDFEKISPAPSLLKRGIRFVAAQENKSGQRSRFQKAKSVKTTSPKHAG